MNAFLPERRFRLRGSCWSDTNPPASKRLGGRFYSVDRAFAKRTVGTVRVAARFFSGVPHPHLLGVRCPDWFPSDISLAVCRTSLLAQGPVRVQIMEAEIVV
jgi:hypothetical protein